MKNQPSHHARFAPEITAGVIAGRITCLTYRHPVKPKLRADSTRFVGMPLMAPNTPKNMAQAIEKEVYERCEDKGCPLVCDG